MFERENMERGGEDEETDRQMRGRERLESLSEEDRDEHPLQASPLCQAGEVFAIKT